MNTTTKPQTTTGNLPTCTFGHVAEVHQYKAHRDGRLRALVTTAEDPERRYWIIVR